MTHPSIDYPQAVVLSEQVRLYARGLLNRYEPTPYEYPGKKEKESEAKYGVVLTKAEKKKQRARWSKKKKKKKSTYQPPVPWLHENDIEYSASQLALLAEQAKLALAEARKQAGEEVIYCCGNIRRTKGYECRAKCSSKQRYQIIRELQGTTESGTDN